MTDPDYKCAFAATLIGHDYGCEHAAGVVRRGGPDIACRDEQAHRLCGLTYETLKTAALPAFGVEDDLLSMPHSVMAKVQFGGLLGLQQVLDGSATGAGQVDNIAQLVSRVRARYPDPELLPLQEIVPTITAVKLRRRR
ncbi:MAG: hypothetical protein JSW10_08955 [Pseudomonadota bacterium]|nr:MAG: hypothetical protein JSW10_08955 [Pseudomonadota bacterium]